jgi:8-oxo-dGTP diphosphatase
MTSPLGDRRTGRRHPHPGAAWSAGAAYTGTAPTLAFDHALILDDGLERIRAKLEYTTIATRFVSEPFALADLRAVYATVWGYDPEPANFRRKVLGTAGFVLPIPASRRRAGPQGGRPPALFNRGPAEQIYPPLPCEPHGPT